MILVKNKFWSGHDLSKAPERITFRKPISDFKLADFLDDKSWENVTQISSMMPFADAKRLADLHLPMWSRDHDRVSLMRPVPGSALEKRKAVIKQLWAVKNKILSVEKLHVGVK